ncbi:hypothetical protein IJI91_03220 [Candidatus Saccharibacteria bacterium]|nr:hypothetical protein [Candidatus Saccharibacteria bacterium]
MNKDLIRLYKERRELTLVEITYFALAVISFVVAGTIALFDQSLGISILIVPLIAMVTGIANIVAWSLIKLFIEGLISRKETNKPGKASK